MSFVTIIISNDHNRLTQQQWAEYVHNVCSAISSCIDKLFFFGGPVGWSKHQNCAWVALIDEPEIIELRLRLAAIRKGHNMDSIAWIEGEKTEV